MTCRTQMNNPWLKTQTEQSVQELLDNLLCHIELESHLSVEGKKAKFLADVSARARTIAGQWFELYHPNGVNQKEEA